MLTVISRSAEDVVLFTLFRIVQLYPFHVCRSVPSFLRRVHRGESGDSYYQSIIDNRSCVFAKVTAMMRILAVAMALLAPAASFSFNGAPLRQSTSVSGTATLERQTVKSGARSMTMMPIGVPKVAYKMPGSRGGEWVDIYNRLTRERIIFMGAEIDDEMANQIIGVLLVSYYHAYNLCCLVTIIIFYSLHLAFWVALYPTFSTWTTRTPISRSTYTSTALEDPSFQVLLSTIQSSTFALRL